MAESIVHIFLDKDESKICQIDNIYEINDIDDIIKKCVADMNLGEHFDISSYGLKAKHSSILI